MSGHSKIASASDLGISLRSVNDLPDVLVASHQHGGLILAETDLCPEFFDLRTGLAGEVLQKFVNYRAKVAIVVSSRDSHGDRFSELMHEHRTHPFVRFFVSADEAKAWFRGSSPNAREEK
jgi:hypothetical protein